MFDEAYGVGYYEDTDLAMSLRHRGHQRVVFQPFAIAYHQEGSTFGSNSEIKTRLMRQNREIFTSKWATHLGVRHNMSFFLLCDTVLFVLLFLCTSYVSVASYSLESTRPGHCCYDATHTHIYNWLSYMMMNTGASLPRRKPDIWKHATLSGRETFDSRHFFS
jgi:hypothetical protein